MRILTLLCLSAACFAAAVLGQNSAKPAALACDRTAISAEERPRHSELARKLRTAARQRIALDDGYRFRLDPAGIRLEEIAEWMSRERKCCPFLVLQVETSGAQPDWMLTIRGPKGVKEFLDAESR